MHQHIGVGGKAHHGVASGLRFQIDRQRLLAAIAIVKKRRYAVFLGADQTPRIANDGRLDLDDFRALRAQHHGGHRAGDHG